MRVRAWFCAAVVGLSVVGCGSDGSETAPSSSAPSSVRVTPSVPPSVTVDENDSGATVPPASPHLPDHGTTPSHPQSSGTPCEGTVCTNPNHGGGGDPAANGGAVMPNPNGDGSNVPCEGTVCTNPNHGAGS